MANDPRMRHFRLDFSGPRAGGASIFGRALGAVAGVGAFVIALFVGGALLLVVLALALAFALVIAVRIWWWKRKMAAAIASGDFESAPSQGAPHRRSDGGETVDAEYREVDR
ncbi:MAG: hypothetical protein AAFO81_12350 [Pseudomonadota bacterium]